MSKKPSNKGLVRFYLDIDPESGQLSTVHSVYKLKFVISNSLS